MKDKCEHCNETGGHVSRECPGWVVDFLSTGRASVVLGTETRDGKFIPRPTPPEPNKENPT